MSTSMTRMPTHTLFLITALAAFLSGCAVTSQPIEKTQSQQRAQADLAQLYQGQEPLTGPLTLHDAMARAVKYNVEARVKIMEEALAERQVNLATFDMLPRIAASAGYVGRNNRSASSSESVLTDSQSLEPSTSQDRDRDVADLTMVWNVLDFGVSYVNAKQQADQRLIVQERRRKVIQTIIQDVRSAYWRAVAADRLLGKIDALLAQVQQAETDSETMSSQLIGDPVQALSYQRALIEATRQLEEQRKALALAKTELAALVNLPMDSRFSLVPDDAYAVPELKLAMKDLEEQALTNRPELREQDYQTRITAAETRKAMLRMLPGLEFSLGGNYDSNSYLVNNRWADYGVKVTWNLLNVLSGPAAIDAAKAGQVVEDARRQAISVAVLAQLYVARANLSESDRQFKVTQKLAGLDDRIVGQLRNRQAADEGGKLTLIQAELNSLQAQLRRDLAYADLRNAFGQVFASAGFDPLPDQVPSASVAALSKALATTEAQWDMPAGK